MHLANKHIDGISFVIPAYNEEKTIGICIDRIKNYQFVDKFAHEIIVSDDGSNDNTVDIVRQKQKEYPAVVKLVEYPVNKGKGHAVRNGCLKAKHELIVILDADLSIDPIELVTSLDIIEKNFYHKPIAIFGDRVQEKKQPLKRQFLGWGFRQLVNNLLWLNIRDTQCPYKVLLGFNRPFFRKLKINGFAYDVELIKKVMQLNIKFVQQTVVYYNNEDSRVTAYKTLEMLKDVLKLKIK